MILNEHFNPVAEFADLLKPKLENLTQEQRLLRACMLAYMKLHPMCALEKMTEAQVSEVLYCEIANTIGDKAFCEWLETWRDSE